MSLFDTIFGVVSGAPVAGAIAQYDGDGNVVGWYLVNPDGTTTTWDASGQHQETTSPSGSSGPTSYIAWNPSMPYPGAITGDAASDALSKGVPPGYVVQIYGPAFPAPPGVGPLTLVPSNIAPLIGSGGPYYVVGVSMAQHFLDEATIGVALPPASPSGPMSWTTMLIIGVAAAIYFGMQGSGKSQIFVERR